MAAGVALAGAGVIAVNPAAPLTTVNQADVQLTSTSDNLEHVFDLITGPNPIFSALGELGSYYGQVANDSFEQAWAGVEGIWSGLGGSKGLETIIPLIIEQIEEGDFSNAYNLLNNDMLFNTQNIFQPLFNHIPRGGTEEIPGILSMGSELAQVWANVLDVFSDFSFWKDASRYIIEPLAGFQFALADNFTDTGDHIAQNPFDALLNGYVPWGVPDGSTAEEPHAAFIGLISPTGSFNYFFDAFPSLIAEALTKELPVPDVDVSIDSGVGGALADASLFDWTWLTDLFS
ncbi:hypothetical protein A5715_02115 [Mycolicibacter heraklionensis]|uniref:Uncharacterized protein n=1 Tax=Mycolicibacter engbaekii TaxID=188915 RepID=A0A1X1TEG5_9MYCO|nr:hypothetical protein A5715_02115 [Mycolicibacter heraklionensis]ORV42898.1 hypothetical protein AWC02_16075 [Mycolicibacter engbaekii]